MSSSDPSDSYASDNIRRSLDRDGFAVFPSLLSPETLTGIHIACGELTKNARAGRWPYIRTLDKPFPPWPSDPSVEQLWKLTCPCISNGIWGVQHLLHPEQRDFDIYAKIYFDKTVTSIVSTICGCSEDELVMELFNLLVRPDHDFALRWHRDDIPATATTEEEEERLGVKKKPLNEHGSSNGETKASGDSAAQDKIREYPHAQWNLALEEDSSLIVVPGSHTRARTEGERVADPFAENLPGMQIVHLNPGDAVFYDNNILHRGVYKHDVPRLTLHGSMGRVGKGDERARNVLQHGIGEWVDQCDFGGLEPQVRERAEGMRERLVDMGRERHVEYSQPLD